MEDYGRFTRREWLAHVKRGVIALVVALTIVGVPAATSLTSFQSAAAQSSDRIKFCVKLPSGNYPKVAFVADLYYWSGSAWVLYRQNGRTDTTGCGTWYQVPVGYYFGVAVRSVSGVWQGFAWINHSGFSSMEIPVSNRG